MVFLQGKDVGDLELVVIEEGGVGGDGRDEDGEEGVQKGDIVGDAFDSGREA